MIELWRSDFRQRSPAYLKPRTRFSIFPERKPPNERHELRHVVFVRLGTPTNGRKGVGGDKMGDRAAEERSKPATAHTSHCLSALARGRDRETGRIEKQGDRTGRGVATAPRPL